MAFSLALRTDKRLKMIDDAGKEEFEQDTLDVSYLALLDPNRVPTAEDGKEQAAEKEEGEEPLNPMEAYEKFTTAKGELDVIVDLITNLEGARYLDFRVLSNKPRRDNLFQELADDSAQRFGRHRASLQDVSQRLRQGAAALRAAAARDNKFYSQATQLQRFWKLRLNPLVAEYADSPFSVDINFMEGQSAQQQQQQGQGAQGQPEAGAEAAAPTKLGLAPTIPLVKHPTGEVCMRLHSYYDVQNGIRDNDKDAGRQGAAAAGTKTQPPVGAVAVHRRLLQLQQQLLWRLVGHCLEDEARAAAAASNFSYSLASGVLASISGSGVSRAMAPLRALVLEHVAACRLPHATITDLPRPYVAPLSSLALLPELCGWISHCFYRDNVYALLDAQAHHLRMVALHWVPTTQPCTSALQVCLTPNHRLLLIVTEKAVEIEGIPSPLGTRSRWAREGIVSITKLELPHVLYLWIQQALAPVT